VLRHEFLERHHLEFVLRGHGRLQHHAIKKQKPPTWRGFVSNLADRLLADPFCFSGLARGAATIVLVARVLVRKLSVCHNASPITRARAMPFPDRPAFQAHAFDPDRANAVCRAVAFVGRKRSRAASWLDDPSRFAMFKSQQFIAAM
ncbi:hypothetical protein, partial [Burkholderia pseudomallei]|uniref:hypothetical protein n=4 Tax=Burkholderia pseudomallei TaxID=28450 RepID=UPI003132EC41|nr:hypothetical protein [Burkholderia pseudomallei]